jgi:hypothetical protein
VHNPALVAATIKGVSDVVSTDIVSTVTCGVTFPYTLNAGGTLQCTYTASLPDSSGRTNTATAVLQNIPSGTTSFSGSASVDFGGAVITEIDKTITVSDNLYGTLGPVTYGVDPLPKAFSYSQLIGPYSSSGDYAVVNTAPFVANDTGTTGSDSWTVTVHISTFGCTYTQGYWKNHGSRITRYLPIWLGTPPVSGIEGDNDSIRVDTATEAHNILSSDEKNNGIIKLYIQLLAAKLNIASGADSAAVTSTIAAADTFLATYSADDWNSLSGADKQQVLAWMTILDDYNNGRIGPGHCPS